MIDNDPRGICTEQSAFDALLATHTEFYREACGQMAEILARMNVPLSEREQFIAATWEEAVIHRHNFAGSGHEARLRCWLLTVVRRKAADARRRFIRHSCESLGTRDEELIDPNQAQQTQTAEEREWLDVQLERISQKNQENVCLFRAHFFEGLSIHELAQQSGRTEKSIDNRIRRVVQLLREQAE